ncbi:MAG: SIMPL domain-containing protein [Ancalomicrobiaceae bacterium]|nr:SIMPL domain-containing protein [Ancalomicrobiaceae bacterium]
MADPPAIPTAEPILSVKGSGMAEVKPDFARLTVSISVTKPTLAEATAALPERAARAMAQLRTLAADGVSVERSDYQVFETRTPIPCKPAAPGCQMGDTHTFSSSISYKLKLEKIDAIATVYTKINAADVFESGFITYDVNDRRASFNLARRDAVADALHQAETYADAAGVKLGGIQSITDDEAAPVNGYADLARPMRAAGAAITIVPPATLSFNASVTMTWRIAPKS